MTRLDELPPGPDGRLRILLGPKLIGFTLPALSGEWEAHWVDAAGHQYHLPASSSTDAARVLRDALKEHRNA